MHLLACGAHADDVELGCGGTLALAASLGHTVSILDLTAGELGSNGDPARRAEEAAAAACALGVGRRENAGLPDGHLSAADLGQRREVAGWLRTLGPDLLIIPGAQNRHPDHSAAHHLLWDAAFLAGLERYDAAGAARRPQRIIETMERFPFAPSFVIGIDAVVEAKRESLRCYASQFLRGGGRAATSINHPDFLEQLLARDRYYGALGGCGYAEPFHSAQVPLVADPAQLLAPAPFDGAGRAS
ncbi:MAG: bacillithiol biosynthesis deacetylase BshB1 [Candidatus Krumholzibacteriia bacterium]